MSSPSGFLGVHWGDNAQDAAVHLGLRCDSWEPWEGGQSYEACFDVEHPVDVFGRKAFVRLFRKGEGLEGLSLRFMHCDSASQDLIDAVRREFGLRLYESTPYDVFEDGAAVRFDYDKGDDSCRLTIAGPQFGKAFQAYVLEGGFRDLSAGLSPG
jgi:hypothetical protein